LHCVIVMSFCVPFNFRIFGNRAANGGNGSQRLTYGILTVENQRCFR
jgi:hypothetical protein